MPEVHRYVRNIHETDLDLFGHVNNAVYLAMLEEARWDFITRRGYGLTRIRELGQGPTILEIHIKYLRELTNRESVTIETELVDYPGKVGRMRQTILKADGAPASEAVLTFGLFDLGARKLVLPTPEWAHAVGLATSA
jgi:acyl-CoA thioester hydrolase